MPLDTSIALGFRPVQLEDPGQVQAKQLQLRTLMLQNQQAEQAAQEGRELADAYKGSVGQNGQLDRQGLYGTMAQRGLGARIPALQKQFAESDEAMTKQQAAQFDLAKKRLDASAGALSSLVALGPNVTHDHVINTVADLVQQGLMDQQQGAQLVRSLPGNPAALPAYLQQKGLQVLDAKSRLEALMPKLTQVDAGGTVRFVDTNPMTNGGSVAPITKTNTPDAVLNANVAVRGQDVTAATARRGQDMTASTAAADRSQRAAQGASAIEKDDKGNLMIVDKTTGVGRPVVGVDGKPVSLGAGQSDAREALKLIDQAEPLLRSGTSSWGGKGIDLLAGAFGYATPGSITSGKLKAIEGALVSKMPKMSGPQSDKDVAMYRQMAGEIGDETVPYQRKLAALDAIREIQERYAGMPKGTSKPAPAAPAAAPVAAPANSAPSALPAGWTVTAH